MSETLLQTDGLTKQFGALAANYKITLSVDRGEIRGLIGPNGSGKTTFFNSITGFYTPDSGSVIFEGTDVTGRKPHRIARQGIGRTFQIAAPFGNMTVRQNMLAVQTPSAVDERERAQEILEFLKIDHLADDSASGMSGGQKKLLGLGRVLMLDPACILLDEPTAGVNPALADRILEHLRDLNDQGTTFLIIEHDMDVLKQIVDTVSVLDQGQHIVQGTFDEVRSDKRVWEAYLGSADEEEVPI